MSFLSNPSLFREKAFINNEWLSAADGRTFPVDNPATGETLARVADCGTAETRRAIAAAEAALPDWKSRTATNRARVLKKWNDLILQNAGDLARLMTLEQGKPLAEARQEVGYGASFFEWFAEEGKRVYGEIIPPYAPNLRLLVMKQPVGVCAAITPWNFPLAMITRKCAPALAAGCSVVVKPSDETPLTALALAALAAEAGMPPGVFNIVAGKDPVPIGEELCSNPVVRKLSFTGSTRVGKLLMAQCAPTVKKLSLELGGNAPFIVFDDADIDAAVAAALASKYRNAGQTCISANRIFVQSGVYEPFLEKLAASVAAQKTGNGLNDGVNIGPLINRSAVEKVERLMADAAVRGARIMAGGRGLGGLFFEPTVVADVDVSMGLMTEEIFGPVAPVTRFETEEEVISMANSTRAGLAAYFYGRDVGRAFRVAEALEFGMVGVNTVAISSAVAPFGGVKESGIGREGGRLGIEEFLEVKYVCMEV